MYWTARKPAKELTIRELLEDPITALMMRNDGVDRRSLELLLETVTTGTGVALPRSRTDPAGRQLGQVKWTTVE